MDPKISQEALLAALVSAEVARRQVSRQVKALYGEVDPHIECDWHWNGGDWIPDDRRTAGIVLHLHKRHRCAADLHKAGWSWYGITSSSIHGFRISFPELHKVSIDQRAIWARPIVEAFERHGIFPKVDFQ